MERKIKRGGEKKESEEEMDGERKKENEEGGTGRKIKRVGGKKKAGLFVICFQSRLGMENCFHYLVNGKKYILKQVLTSDLKKGQPGRICGSTNGTVLQNEGQLGAVPRHQD